MQRENRRLAAIVAADIVGYSRLIGEDEEGTLQAMRAHRAELINPLIEQHGGRIANTAGDSLLLEFASVVDAVRCSIAIQLGMAERNQAIEADRRVEFRIGINVGDVIAEGGDLLGDGVNVAARLETMCNPGGLILSDDAYRQVRDRLELSWADGGTHEVKNIARAIQVWRWSDGLKEMPGHLSVEGEPPPLPDKPSIAVLPFDNMSGDPDQEYFSDGIAEDIITDLSKISALLVVARNSSFAYKGSSVDIRRVATDLGVAYILEGSVRRAANRVRITAQLIDGADGVHLWAERYDRDMDDIFAIQDEITREVVAALKITLRLDEQARIGNQATSNMEAYDLALRAISMVHRHDRDGTIEARGLFEQALTLDPNYLTPHFGLVIVLGTIYANNWGDAPEAALDRGYALAARAVEIDPQDPQGHWAMSLANMWKKALEPALAEAEFAIELAPNMSEAYAIRGYLLSFAGRPGEAIESLETAMRLDPKNPDIWWHFLGHAYFIAADYIAAIEVLERRIRRNPETDISRVLLAACCGHLGRGDEARQAWREALEINPDYSLAQKAKVLPYKNHADWDRLVDGLRKAGITQD